jgi:hypothetical protein
MEHRYWAFISYSHRDEQWAKWLHRTVETYRIPKRLVGSVSRGGGPVPRRLFPVFRDRDELEGAASLSGRIEETLQQSRSLVVVCSPAAAQSKWVEEEIQAFRRLNGDEHVLAFVVAGEPNASDQGRPDDECFPRGLRVRTTAAGTLTGVRVEPLAADARNAADGKRGALLKIVAAVAGLRYDDLRQRDAQRRMRVMALSAAVLGVVALIMAGLAAYALVQQRNAIAGRLAVESRFEADKHYDLSLLLANEAVHVRNTLETRSALLSAVLRQPRPAAQLRFHTKRVYGLAFSPDGRTLATGAEDGVVALWDVASRQRSSIPPLDVGGEVTSVAFHPAGTLIAVGNRGQNTSGSLNAGRISYWDVATGKPRPEVSESDANAWALRFTEDGRLLAADGDGRATMWRVGQRLPEWASTRVNELAGYDVALDTRGKWIAVGSEESELSLLSFSDRNKALPLPKVHRGSVQGIAFSPVDETLASVDSNGTVVLWNLATRMPRDDESADAGVQSVTRIAYTSDGKRLAIGTGDGTVLMWDVDKREPREVVVTGHGDAVMSVAFNADDTLLAVGLASGLALLADLRGGEHFVEQQHLPAKRDCTKYASVRRRRQPHDSSLQDFSGASPSRATTRRTPPLARAATLTIR